MGSGVQEGHLAQVAMQSGDNLWDNGGSHHPWKLSKTL